MRDVAIHTVGGNGRLTFVMGNSPEWAYGLRPLIGAISVELLSDYNEITGRGTDLQKRLSQLSFDDVAAATRVATDAARIAFGNVARNFYPGSKFDFDIVRLDVEDVRAGASFIWEIDFTLVTSPDLSASFTVSV